MNITFSGRTFFPNKTPGSYEQVGKAAEYALSLLDRDIDASMSSDSSQSAVVLTNNRRPHLDTLRLITRAENRFEQKLTSSQRQQYEKLQELNGGYYATVNSVKSQFNDPKSLNTRYALFQLKKQFKDTLKELAKKLK